MSAFGQICEDVATITDRASLMPEIQIAVRGATQFFHLKEFWQRDCIERLLPFDSASFTFQIDTVNTLERFRKVRYVKKWSTTSNAPLEDQFSKITECSPDQLFDRYNAIKQNIYYLAGSSLNLRLSTQEQNLLIAWYVYPNTSPEAYSSWIAEMYPDAITNLAASKIQRSIGMTEDANRREKWALEIDYPLIAAQEVTAFAP